MTNLNNAKIYKIISSVTNDVYVGSTCSKYLAKRKADHKYDYKRYSNGNFNYVRSFDIIGKGNYEFVLIENYPCKNKIDLYKRERYWIEKTDNCINKNIPSRSRKEYLKNRRLNKKIEKEIKYMKEQIEKDKKQDMKQMEQFNSIVTEYEKAKNN